MKKLLLLLVSLVTLPTFASVSANVSFASDYIWRGMTQTDGPAMSGGFDYSYLKVGVAGGGRTLILYPLCTLRVETAAITATFENYN